MVLSKILDITGSMEIGRELSSFVLSPFSKTGITLNSLSLSGKIPVCSDSEIKLYYVTLYWPHISGICCTPVQNISSPRRPHQGHK